MTFRPYPTRSGFILLGVTIISGAVAIYFINLLLQQGDLPTIFKLLVGLLLALGLMSMALYWMVIAFKLRYYLNRNGLAIQWGLAWHLIPVESIIAILPGKDLSSVPKFRGLNIAGLRFGWGELAEYGVLRFHTTTALANSLLIITPGQNYVISPHQSESFIKAWQARQQLGPTQQWSMGFYRSWPLSIPFLTDHLTWWLWGLAALSCLALFGYLSLSFPTLPNILPIHFNALGEVERVANKSALLMLPGVGAIVIILNVLLGCLIYHQEKVAAYLLWGGAIVVQLGLWGAVLSLIG